MAQIILWLLLIVFQLHWIYAWNSRDTTTWVQRLSRSVMWSLGGVFVLCLSTILVVKIFWWITIPELMPVINACLQDS